MTPRIYVACLASYNAGRLHGAWIDADQDPEAIHEGIDTMLSESPIPGAEEWAVHDTEGLPDLGEFPDLERLAAIAQGIAEHGEAFRAYLECFNADQASEDDFLDRYQGEFDDEAAYAEDLLDSTGALDAMPDHLAGYFDFGAYGRDLLLNGEVCRSGYYWFANY